MTKWISVKNRLPKENVTVLIYSQAYSVEDGCYSIEYDSWYGSLIREDDDCYYPRRENITHWMPLPKPPRK